MYLSRRFKLNWRKRFKIWIPEGSDGAANHIASCGYVMLAHVTHDATWMQGLLGDRPQPPPGMLSWHKFRYLHSFPLCPVKQGLNVTILPHQMHQCLLVCRNMTKTIGLGCEWPAGNLPTGRVLLKGIEIKNGQISAAFDQRRCLTNF